MRSAAGTTTVKTFARLAGTAMLAATTVLSSGGYALALSQLQPAAEAPKPVSYTHLTLPTNREV